MRLLILTGLIFATTMPAHADVALMLNDNEQTAFRQILDAAVRGQGIQVAPEAVYLLNKLNTAPQVVPHKDDPPPAKSEEPKQ